MKVRRFSTSDDVAERREAFPPPRPGGTVLVREALSGKGRKEEKKENRNTTPQSNCYLRRNSRGCLLFLFLKQENRKVRKTYDIFCFVRYIKRKFCLAVPINCISTKS